MTLSGKQAREIIKHSGLLQSVLEEDPALKKLTVPISLPYGREALFKKLMTGQPVGRHVLTPSGFDYVEFFPLSPEEEEIINTVVNTDSKNFFVREFQFPLMDEVNLERQQAIEDVLRFFMFDDPRFAQRFVKIEPLGEENQETLRRKKISMKRFNPGKSRQQAYPLMWYSNAGELADPLPNTKALPFLNEDTIESLVEKHKNYLFGMHNPVNKKRLNQYLTRKNQKNRQKRFEEQKDARLKSLANQVNRRRYRRTRGRANENDYYNNSLNANLEESQTNPYYFYEHSNFDVDSILNRNLYPFSNKPLNRMSSLEFERYLRSLRREGEEKYLPYQGPLVGNFFGNTNSV